MRNMVQLHLLLTGLQFSVDYAFEFEPTGNIMKLAIGTQKLKLSKFIWCYWIFQQKLFIPAVLWWKLKYLFNRSLSLWFHNTISKSQLERMYLIQNFMELVTNLICSQLRLKGNESYWWRLDFQNSGDNRTKDCGTKLFCGLYYVVACDNQATMK